MLMFGNQQNRPGENSPSSSYTSSAEKREYLKNRARIFQNAFATLIDYSFVPSLGTLAASGLGGLKVALAEEEKSPRSNTPTNTLYDRDSYSPYDKNYE